MKEKRYFYEVQSVELETVEDMIKALAAVPKGYLLHPLGQKCAMAVNHYHKCVHLDESNWIECFEEELKEDMKEEYEKGLLDADVTVTEEQGVEISVDSAELETFTICAIMGYSDICQNGNYEAQLMGIFSSQEKADECGKELVEAGVIHHYEVEYPKLDEFGYK